LFRNNGYSNWTNYDQNVSEQIWLILIYCSGTKDTRIEPTMIKMFGTNVIDIGSLVRNKGTRTEPTKIKMFRNKSDWYWWVLELNQLRSKCSGTNPIEIDSSSLFPDKCYSNWTTNCGQNVAKQIRLILIQVVYSQLFRNKGYSNWTN
jgi:hypothetical protein